MEGGTANGDKEKTKRRETIHVVSKPVVKEPEPQPVKKQLDTSRSARRTTIAATNSNSSFSVTNNVSIDPEPPVVKPNRRSSRYSSTSSEKKAEVAPTKRKTAILEEEDSEDDLILIEAAETAEKKQVTPSRAKAASSQESRDRRSRSASLQKSPTVTTSYKKDVPSTVHETEESGTDTEILTQKVYNYDVGKPFVPTKTERETYYKPPAPLNTSTSRYSTNSKLSKLTTATTVTSGLGSSNLSRRYTTGTSHKYETYEDDNDDGEELEIGGGNTPYYSDFARRLERLKNEQQLNMSGKNVNREYSVKRDIPASRNYPRRQESQEANALQAFFFDMERKFKIKQKLMIIFAVFLLLTVYIFIFH